MYDVKVRAGMFLILTPTQEDSDELEEVGSTVTGHPSRVARTLDRSTGALYAQSRQEFGRLGR